MSRFCCKTYNFFLLSATTFRNLQQPSLLQDKVDSWVVKRAKSPFNSFCTYVAIQVASCCCPFYRTFNTNCILHGRMEDFVIWGPRAIAYSGNIGAIAPIRTANGTLFEGVSGACSSGKLLRLKFSEMQPSTFWTLKFSKCLDSILNMQRWNI